MTSALARVPILKDVGDSNRSTESTRSIDRVLDCVPIGALLDNGMVKQLINRNLENAKTELTNTFDELQSAMISVHAVIAKLDRVGACVIKDFTDVDNDSRAERKIKIHVAHGVMGDIDDLECAYELLETTAKKAQSYLESLMKITG